MKKKATMIVAAIALAAVVASPAMAYRGSGGQNNRGPGYGTGMRDGFAPGRGMR